MRTWLEPLHGQPRFTKMGGVDHGSDGQIIVEVRKGNSVYRRMIWFKGHKRPAAGVRGFGHIYEPASLRVVNGGGYYVKDVLEKGRLTQARLREHQAEIEKSLECHCFENIKLGETLIVQLD